jgi:hypothetical protein
MIQAYLDGGSGSTMEQIIMKQAYGDIVRLIAERDEMHRELRKAETECSMLRIECGVLEKNAEMTYENHQRIVKELTAERDEARQEVCRRQKRSVVFDEALAEANRRGWDCFKEDGNAK